MTDHTEYTSQDAFRRADPITEELQTQAGEVGRLLDDAKTDLAKEAMSAAFFLGADSISGIKRLDGTMPDSNPEAPAQSASRDLTN